MLRPGSGHLQINQTLIRFFGNNGTLVRASEHDNNAQDGHGGEDLAPAIVKAQITKPVFDYLPLPRPRSGHDKFIKPWFGYLGSLNHGLGIC